ncbi:glycoside hydrolase family 32 protein [Litoribacter ruber]|uniref:glycoside hydrolase family 32 protein n=1 Tax=Litoribacter ruber TaxID=702568 RepID=UPI001BD99B8D|nr:glycoside hydrolase family 32 protein [Litoribacter ruber]MBT0811607.1 glycoside hydrolase family 32 protein [Litoribacter ruber]
MRKAILSILALGAAMISCSPSELNDVEQEKFRPKFHFSPEANWMNDPNGMVYYEGEYHLFFQYYPDSTVWGPMHWGHAVSKDLVVWEEMGIALYPDELGYIFSGSAVADHQNTAGFKSGEHTPLVAIFTHHHDENGEVQSLAFSNDRGRTWEKYENNPVLPNPGIQDFRDPKVMWHEEGGQWIMSLAAKDVIHFYSSPNLKDWTFESEFGKGIGAKGGVWECPDLFEIKGEDGRSKWVLFVSINPGAPNGGSGTQYFTGEFDGKTFAADHQDEKWLDWGTDNYAGVTWANVPKEDGRTFFMGWMNNWLYGDRTPTEGWRGAMTLARELVLVRDQGDDYIAQKPVREFYQKLKPSIESKQVNFNEALAIGSESGFVVKLSGFQESKGDIKIKLFNENGEELLLNLTADKISLDRSSSGETGFHPEFGKIQEMPYRGNNLVDVELVVDASSIEVFINDGLYAMTAQVFNKKPLNLFEIISIGTGKKSALRLDVYQTPSFR